MASKRPKEDTVPKLAIVKDKKGDEKGDGNDGGAYEHDELRRTVLRLRDKADESYWELAVVMEEIYTNNIYRTSWGYESWPEYVEKELDMHRRKGQYLVQLQLWFKTLPPNVQKWVRGIGWTKARLLVGVVTAENATEWRKKIEGKTAQEITDMMQGAKKGNEVGDSSESATKEKEPTEKMSFSLIVPFQRDNVNAALEKAKDEAQSDKTGHLLDLICTDYLSTNAAIKDRNDYLQHVEKSVGLTLLAYDESAGEIIYGADLVERLYMEDEGDSEDS